MERIGTASRETSESNVAVEIHLDGTGKYDVSTGNGMLDHMLSQLARHSLFDLTVKATGDTSAGWHHVVEDTAIVLGWALRQAVGDGQSIHRMAHALVPLDEALALVAVDVSGRGYANIELGESQGHSGDLDIGLVKHFLESFALEARIALHVRMLSGDEAHHRMEAVFKSLAKALRRAVEVDDRQTGAIPSTKGSIGG